MSVNFSVNNFSIYNKPAFSAASTPLKDAAPSFKGREELTSGQADALAAQHIAAQNMNNKKQNFPHIREKDINFEVTCVGYSQIEGNTRDIYDYRCSMQSAYGIDWSKNFNRPCVVRNGNIDEKVNGPTTAIVFPLHPETPGFRNADHMAMVLNGNVPNAVLNELVDYMGKVGIINFNELYGKKHYVNSNKPKIFMSNPKIKTLIANFFRQKESALTNAVDEAKSVSNDTADSKLRTTDINISNIGCKQDKNNTREVKDYLRAFMENDKKMTVVYDKYTENNQEKDMTVILIPSTKSKWDCITVTIDKKIPQEECKNLINHLVKTNMANVESDGFRQAIADYFKK